METISIQVPASLYAALFQRFGESTTETITKHLLTLLDEGEQTLVATSPYSRPKAGTITGKVWDIADRVQKETGNADRDAVVKACLLEGININTASTQYSYWRKANPL